jgi:hypothetical protein
MSVSKAVAARGVEFPNGFPMMVLKLKRQINIIIRDDKRAGSRRLIKKKSFGCEGVLLLGDGIRGRLDLCFGDLRS